MSSFDFALKDFYRKRHTNYPLLLIITLTVGFTEFLIYFTSSLGLNIFIQTDFINQYYFSGGIHLIYKEFNSLIQILLIILSIAIVIAVTTTLVISKKKDIAIMRSLGTLPKKLYSFYLLEAYILFFIGFILGLFSGLIAYGISALIMSFLNFPITFQIDLIYTPILFFSCLIGIFFITGYTIRKIGRKSIIKNFSKDIPYNYNASKNLKFVSRWLTSIGFNFKIAVINTSRKKGEFKRYIIVFSIIALIIFTLGLGTIVLSISSREWIDKSQNENIIAIGHEDVIYNYSLLYKMFSDPTLLINGNNINFAEPQYLFNINDIEGLYNVDGVEKIEERVINFYDVEEISGYHYFPGDKLFEAPGYKLIGSNRRDNIPIIGINPRKIIHDFEIEGNFFTEEDAFDNMIIGDGLAYNFFEYALDQSLRISPSGKSFHISGVLIDTLFSGYAGYISINESRKLLNLDNDLINIVLLKLSSGTYHESKEEIDSISKSLGANFTHLRLDDVFQDNLKFLSNLSLYPLFLIIIISVLAILSLYNYQKSEIMEKAKDFLIMRALGSKLRSLKKILFIESFLILVPSLLVGLGFGMLINSIFLMDRVYLPPLYVPFMLFFLLIIVFTIFNFLSLIPIIKKINKFSIKDFNIY